MRLALAAAILVLPSCWAFRRVHQEHLDAWRGQPISKVERHPVWGVPASRTTLSDGAVAYQYVSKGAIFVQGNTVSQAVCTSTFIVKNDVIEQLTMQGQCYSTDASMPPP
jgi:hypothetical protein